MKLSKVLSLVLAIAMLFSVPTFAAFTDVAADATYAEAVTVLSALDIIKGYDDGSFQPEGKIKRSEYAAIICRILNMNDAEANKVGGIFTDVAADYWASGYIATASQLGIVNGMGDGTFAPEAEVTYEQAVKMLVAALGYELKAQSLGGYPTGYMMIANQESITVGTTNAPGGAARATVARLTYNSLTVPMMEQASWGTDVEIKPDPKTSILWSKLNAFKAEVKVADVPLSKTATDVTINAKEADKVAKANFGTENAYAGEKTLKINDVDLSGLQGLTVTAIIDKAEDEYKLICIVPKTGKNKEVVIDPELLVDARDANDKVVYFADAEDDKESKLKLADEITTYVNLEEGDYADDVTPNGDASAYRFVDTDNNGAYDTVFVDVVEIMVVDSVNTKTNKIYSDGDALDTGAPSAITLDPENENLDWTITDAEGNALEIADIEAGSVLAYKLSNKDGVRFYEIAVSNDVIEGTVDEQSIREAKVEGVDDVFVYTIGDGVYTTIDGTELVPGDKITAKVYGDKIVAFDVAEGTRNYGVVIAQRTGSDDYESAYYVQVLTQKGEIVSFKLASKVNGDELDANFFADADKGKVIAYELNNAGEIKTVDMQAGSGFATTELVRTTVDLRAADLNFKESSAKLGSYNITDATVVITAEEDAADVNKDNIYLSTADIFEDGETYEAVVVYNDTTKNAEFVVLFNAISVNMNTFPMLITKTSTVSGGKTKLIGYVNGEKTEIIVSENASETVDALGVGDVAMYTLNADGEMVDAFVLASKGATAYTVVDNYADGVESDNDDAIAYAYNTLSLTTGVDNRGDAEDDVTIKGFAMAGKAYSAKGGTVRLINDYDATFDGDERVYDEEEGDEAYITDVDVTSNFTTYFYNVDDNKFGIGSVSDADTDVSTKDATTEGQTDNDDIIYIYNFDGETKLILVIDVNGNDGVY